MRDKKIFFKSFVIRILVLFFSGLGSESLAICVMSKSPPVHFYTALSNPSSGLFFGENEINLSSYVNRCFEDSGKYLMLSLGVARANYYSDILDISADGKLLPTSCHLEGLPVPSRMTISDIELNLLKSYRTLRSCWSLRVEDLGGQTVDVPQNISRCSVKSNSLSSVELNGDYCFVKIRSGSEFKVTPVLNSKCEDSAYLKQMNIHPRDVQAFLNLYVTGDTSGLSSDIRPLGTRSLQWHLQPYKEMMSLSSNYANENLQFPAEYNVDVHMGEAKIFSRAFGTEIYLSKFVQNISREICHNFLCSSPSSYFHPVYSQVELFQKDSQKNFRSIDIWHGGGMVPPVWEGLVRMGSHRMSGFHFKSGEEYKIEMQFSDPLDDYLMYLNWAKQILIRLPAIGSDTNMLKLEPFNSLQLLQGIPIIPGLSGTGPMNQHEELEKVLTGFNRLIGGRAWPENYSLICDSLRQNCVRSGKYKFYSKIIFQFKIGSFNPITQEWALDNKRIKKVSSVFSGYDGDVESLPYLKCGAN